MPITERQAQELLLSLPREFVKKVVSEWSDGDLIDTVDSVRCAANGIIRSHCRQIDNGPDFPRAKRPDGRCTCVWGPLVSLLRKS